METRFELEIYTPRWGHTDTYTFDLSRERMEITMGARGFRCVWQDNQDALWEGESLFEVFTNDQIYAPQILPDLLERAWIAWRGGELDDEAVRAELQEVADWLNVITESKPRTEFWRRYF